MLITSPEVVELARQFDMNDTPSDPVALKSIGDKISQRMRQLDNSMIPGSKKFERVSAMIADGVSHYEIRRTLGVDYRTLHKHFPGTAREPGGGGDNSELRAMRRKMEAL